MTTVPVLAGPRGTARAVQVVLVVGRRVDLEHHGDVVDVDAARGDVGRDEDRKGALAEGAEHPVADALAQPAVQRRRQHALLAQLLGDAVGAELGADEDHGAARGGSRPRR